MPDTKEFIRDRYLDSDYIKDLLEKEEYIHAIVFTSLLVERVLFRSIAEKIQDGSIQNALKLSKWTLGRKRDFCKDSKIIANKYLKKIKLLIEIRNLLVHDLTYYSTHHAFEEAIADIKEAISNARYFLQNVPIKVRVTGGWFEDKETGKKIGWEKEGTRFHLFELDSKPND